MSSKDRVALTKRSVKLYQSGWSVRQIAADLNYSYGTTYNLLAEGGVKFRPRGGSRKKKQ